jgi:Archaeal fructose-1,6-bisphosphatase and related enzymes of inositol monophosphatase family
MAIRKIEEFNLAMKSITAGIDIIDQFQSDFSVKTKESLRDVVTQIDINIESKIKDILKSSNHKIIGEESFVSGEHIGLENETFWVIDPIDGTTNMVSGIPFYAISLGLIEKKKFELGAVAIPSQKELYFTFENKSCLNNRRLIVVPKKFEESLNACAFSSKTDDLKRTLEYDVFGQINDSTRGCLRTGAAAVNICYVAAGKLQSAYGINNRIWDVAGALAVAYYAGANIYVEWKEDPSYISYVVGVPGVAENIVNLLQDKSLANLSLLK